MDGDYDSDAEKHPHGRGEDRSSRKMASGGEETPPRAWGRQRRSVIGWPPLGNTPTGVGKTPLDTLVVLTRQKHPHGRGEDVSMTQINFNASETPPRAWGRREEVTQVGKQLRNTPTGVGKTSPLNPLGFQEGKHPHGRGEDVIVMGLSLMTKETPPRAWGRLLHEAQQLRQKGNTPTGVGKTSRLSLLRLGG